MADRITGYSVAGNSVALISCVTNQIILIRNIRPIIAPKSNYKSTQTATSFLIKLTSFVYIHK